MDWSDLKDISLLIVDDDHFTRELISMMLKKVAKIRIDEASTGEEALLFLQTKIHKIDMIFLDYYMPGMNGSEFISVLKTTQDFNEIPIVLITTDRLSQNQLKDVGADFYMTKPFNFATFSADVKSYLEQIKYGT